MDENIYIPDGFLEEEVRDDWQVTTKMKKVWAISIALIEQVRIICERHGLTYYAIGGTAIGALRHRGFIPWDDDIDIALKREDYDKFIEYAQEELKFPFFLQTPLTDPGFYNKNFARIRHSLSTGISPYDGKLKCNNGIFIDIMPLDGYQDTFRINAQYTIEKLRTIIAWNKVHYGVMDNAGLFRKIAGAVAPIVLGGSPQDFYQKHELRARKYTAKNLPQLGWQYAWMRSGTNHRNWTFDKEIFDDVVYKEFEYIKLPLPIGYDAMLKHQFGNYMEFPPLESRGKHHGLEFEPDIDYKTYCTREYGIKY